MRTFNLFISHSWNYRDQYNGLISLLERKPYFRFHDYSVPRDDPIHDAKSTDALRRAIKQQMAPASVVLILAGVYATYSKWIDEEIDLAESGFMWPKPIIAIKPWGNKRISDRVKNAADQIVGWNTDSIVRAIKEAA